MPILEPLRQIFIHLERDLPAAAAGITELYAEDMTFRDPIQEVHGRAAFIEVTKRFFGRARHVRVVLGAGSETESAAFLAWTMEASMKVGPTVKVDGVSEIRVRDGRIDYHRDYFDLVGSAMDAVPGVRGVYRAAVRRLG